MSKIAHPNKPLADVNVIEQADGSHEIVACFTPEPDLVIGEGNSKAFLALDASLSLKKMYGMGSVFGGDPNYVQAVARKLGSILAMSTRSAVSSGIYWAVSPDGGKIEEIGEFDEAGWGVVSVAGPKKEKWGRGTKLLPAIKHGIEQVAPNADFTMGVIVTDGIIEDEQECIDYCLQVAQEIADGKRNKIKLVLIGIGEEIDEAQLERFDDMTEGTNVDYDMWSHGLASSMLDEDDILAVLYAELMGEIIVAPTGRVEDGKGNVLMMYADGMPGVIRFTLPKGENEFAIKVGAHTVSQDVSEAFGNP